MRELVVLGTASQVPTRTRNHNGYFLRWDAQGVLFDPGEGTQRQMTYAGVSPPSITRICLTHVHGDHCFGLPGVLARMAVDGVRHPVDLHYPASGEEVVRALVGLAGPGVDVRLRPHGSGGEIAEGLQVVPLRHRVETYGYRLVEPDGRTLVPELLRRAGVAGPDVGRLQRDGILGGVRLADVSVPRRGQRFAIVMDTAECEGAEELVDHADLLLSECTFGDEAADLAAAYLHLTAGQAGALAAGGGARALVLSHFSSRYPDVAPLLEQARARSPSTPVVAAADLDRFTLPPRRAPQLPRPEGGGGP